MRARTLLALGMALAATAAEARVISVQMSAPTIAFGGYSWPGVGQYEKITGVAYAEVDPADRRNAIIVDIGLAQTQAAPGQPGKTPSGKIAYLLNFYILKPVNLNAVDRSLNGYGIRIQRRRDLIELSAVRRDGQNHRKADPSRSPRRRPAGGSRCELEL